MHEELGAGPSTEQQVSALMIINGNGRPRKNLGVTISLPSFGLAWYHHLPGCGTQGKSLKVPQTLILPPSKWDYSAPPRTIVRVNCNKGCSTYQAWHTVDTL